MNHGVPAALFLIIASLRKRPDSQDHSIAILELLGAFAQSDKSRKTMAGAVLALAQELTLDARAVISAALCLLVFEGCALARTGEDRLSYRPSVSVEKEDYHHCDARARAAAQRALNEASDEAETFALMTGGLGAWLSVEYGLSVERSAYEETFEDCLRDKGYEIDD